MLIVIALRILMHNVIMLCVILVCVVIVLGVIMLSAECFNTFLPTNVRIPHACQYHKQYIKKSAMSSTLGRKNLIADKGNIKILSKFSPSLLR
jgi:hypothetical protein